MVVVAGDKLDKAKAAIVRTLRYYPRISRSMLSLHVRPGHPEWDQALEALIEDGVVIRKAVVRDTNRAAVIYFLREDADADADADAAPRN